MARDKIGKVKAVLLLAGTMTIMAGAAISPSIPEIQEMFSMAPDAFWLVPLVLTMPGLFIAILGPFAGALIDWIGRKKPLLLGLFFYALSGSSGLYLHSLETLLLGRALLGLSVALVMTSTTTLISDYFTGYERERFLGLQAAFMGLGGLVFLLTGGLLADMSWRAPFAIYLISLFLIPCVWWWIDDPVHRVKQEKGTTLDANQFAPIPKVLFIYLMAFLGMLFFYLIPVELPTLLMDKLHASAARAGIAIGFASVFSAVSAVLFPHIRYYFSHITVYGLLFFLLGIGFFVLSVAGSFSLVVIGAIFSGLAFGLLFPNSSVWLTNSVSPLTRGRWIGGLSSALFFGQFIVPILYHPLIQLCGIQGPCGAFNVTCFVSLALAILLFSCSWMNGVLHNEK